MPTCSMQRRERLSMNDRTLGHMPRRPSPSLFRSAIAALGILALATSSGCSPKAPLMRVNGAQIEGASIAMGLPGIGAIMRVYVLGENQNSFDIQIRGVRGEVQMLNGRYRLPVSMALGTWLPSERTTPFNFSINIPVTVGIAILHESVTMACIPYTLQGVADVTATSTFRLDRDNYPISQNGCIPRQALLSAMPGG